ncbi:uncharacterized protein BXIN_0267 [Babesia sp. Xinjiang]|uniref:uncharacterized protein n=1 Tax=Babesia sp. Xinjiang TaxID=462227 RepID=UPI000A257DCB|nr:uncharacterized protein BXIN_0267 [Babesia sp. Xinjiang]ORM39656.1 hypothetical protein BXIN_0267 [Babesia sp. Xinjiang]
MEVRVVCDCTGCSSRIIQIAGVNILCNLPTKLLRECQKELVDQPICTLEHTSNQKIYETIVSSDIHLIIATTARGLDGLDTLKELFNIEQTYIVCTRPVYTIASIALTTRHTDAPVAAIVTEPDIRKKRNKEKKQEDLTEIQENNHDEQYYIQNENEQNNDEDDTENITWNELSMEFDNISEHSNVSQQTDGSSMQCSSPDATDNENDWVKTRSKYLEIDQILNNTQDTLYPFNQTNDSKVDIPVLKDPDLPTTKRLITLSYNETVTIEIDATTTATHKTDTDIAWDADKQYPLISTSIASFKTQIEICAFSSGYALGSANWTIKHPDSDTYIAIIGETGEIQHKRYCTPVDLSFLNMVDMVILLDNAVAHYNEVEQIKIQTTIKRELDNENYTEIDTEMKALCDMALQGMQHQEGVVIVTDPYTETIMDIIEQLYKYLKQHMEQHQQAYIYVIGDGMIDIFNFADKCAEWVETTRAELTMHHENPLSPFLEIAQMRESNILFVGNKTNDIKDVYRLPSVVIAACDLYTIPFIIGRIHSGAQVITTTEEYRQELLQTAEEMEIHADVTSVSIDFRMKLEQLLRTIDNKTKIIVSENMKKSIPSALNVLVGDDVKVPTKGGNGYIRAEIGIDDAKKTLAQARPFGTSAIAANVNVKVNDADDITLIPADVVDDSKFTFGTFTPQQLMGKLIQLGFTECAIRNQNEGYPVEITVDDECCVILESQYETCVDTTSADKRKTVTQALEQLCTVL